MSVFATHINLPIFFETYIFIKTTKAVTIFLNYQPKNLFKYTLI